LPFRDIPFDQRQSAGWDARLSPARTQKKKKGGYPDARAINVKTGMGGIREI